MSAGSISERFTQPKIEFACTCGKKYRVAANKAGKHVRCKNCRLRVQVPDGDTNISARTRTAILDELGINTEIKKTSTPKRYACSLCGAKIKEVGSAYGEAGLVCALCRETMGGGAATEAAPSEKKGKKKKKKQLDTWTRGVDPEAARNKALAYGGLFFLGTLGFCFNVLSLGWLGSIAAAGAVAYGGGKSIYTGYLAEPVKAKTVK
jgi:DNA-directed RNA polymerase subunit RPC12/RpoP